jgi:multidrug efflux pump subunit AcrA (membrane-fusion protein)
MRYVLVIDGDRIARRDVMAGALDDATGMVPIESGLKEGERVIVSPATDIEVGARVRDATSAPPAGETR